MDTLLHAPPAVDEFPHLQETISKFQAYSAFRGGSYGSTLAPNDILGQVLMTKGCLAAGVPMNALKNPVMKEALAHFGVQLPSPTHLANHIPFILEEEVCASNNLRTCVICCDDFRTK